VKALLLLPMETAHFVAPSPSRSTTATWAPLVAYMAAMAAPMPEAPPVTSAIRPSRPKVRSSVLSIVVTSISSVRGRWMSEVLHRFLVFVGVWAWPSAAGSTKAIAATVVAPAQPG
jgi:hypothetical protein